MAGIRAASLLALIRIALTRLAEQLSFETPALNTTLKRTSVLILGPQGLGVVHRLNTQPPTPFTGSIVVDNASNRTPNKFVPDGFLLSPRKLIELGTVWVSLGLDWDGERAESLSFEISERLILQNKYLREQQVVYVSE
ncbi:hypothetical protein B0H16DRAFT_1474733 [Mycena metata]|uniref:Uncharacterized protein n=1 Tax=Mycena metata TaxID=1033252 RepID=A0AAD7HFM8_9AGAR|nr:hypothetical protein B0H16DRAFT_1474733 [Mycena metata]